jgi:hypothetical protein
MKLDESRGIRAAPHRRAPIADGLRDEVQCRAALTTPLKPRIPPRRHAAAGDPRRGARPPGAGAAHAAAAVAAAITGLAAAPRRQERRTRRRFAGMARRLAGIPAPAAPPRQDRRSRRQLGVFSAATARPSIAPHPGGPA